MDALGSAFTRVNLSLSTIFRRDPGESDNLALVRRDELASQPRYTYDMQNGINGTVKHTNEGTDGVGNHVNENGENHGRPTSDGKSNAWQAGWNVGNCMQGIGILSLPYTVKEGGTAALVTMAVVLLIGNYTSKVLVRCMYEEREVFQEEDQSSSIVKRKVHDTYADIADACFKGGSKVLNVMQLIDIVAVATLYLELAGHLLVDTFTFIPLSTLAWTIVCAVLLLPTVFFKTLTNISWLSLVAIVSLILMFSSVVWFSLDHTISWDLSSMPGFRLDSFSLSSSIILFNFGCQFLVPSVEDSLRDKTQFDSMVNWTYFITGVLTLSYAFFAFLTFGEETKEFITYNMLKGILQTSVSLMFVIKSLLSYPLMIFLIVNTVDALGLSFVPRCFGGREGEGPSRWAYVFRILLVMFTLLLAVVVPHFTLLMGFTGSLTAPWLDFIFPCLFHLKLRRGTLSFWSIAINWGVILIGVIGGVVGLIYSTMNLFAAIWSDLHS